MGNNTPRIQTCPACDFAVGDGGDRQLNNHIEAAHLPEDFGLEPMADGPTRETQPDWPESETDDDVVFEQAGMEQFR